MEMLKENLPVAMLVLGIFGFLFGVFQFFVNRKTAKLTYVTQQFSDFGMPENFFYKIKEAPLLIEIRSAGNKAAENIRVALECLGAIKEVNVKPKLDTHQQATNQLDLIVPQLNPREEIKISILVEAPPNQDQIVALSISHKEGVGIDLKSRTLITTTALGHLVEINPVLHTIKLLTSTFYK